MPDGFRIEQCRACGLAATAPAVPADEIGRWYPARYYGDTNRRFHPLLERLIPRFRMRRADEVERRTGAKGGRMLDVGCGRGLLPSLMRARGWEAEGVEISDDAARHAREVLGLPVFVGPFVAYPGAPSSFDAVVIWHVLEHLPDPRAALEKAHALLKPGGLLMVAVPNFESAQAAFAGPHWFHLDVPRHYFHFRLRVLARLLAETGFEVETVSHFNLEQNPYGWIQSLLNRLGFRFNLLYDLLKQPSARSEGHPFRERPLATLLTAAALVPIVPISFALFLLEVAARRGGTVEVYARKPAGR
jgi:2-polyprenyl-3-methyl-5-hydroxy-6-metoxy-1,4-benzoquinol methylase